MKLLLTGLATVAAFAFCAPLALAQNAASMAPAAASSTTAHAMQHPHPMQHQHMRMGHRMMGRHMMPSTIDSVNHDTGIVELTTGGKHLRVHFPPPTITKLKAGDKITLMLGYKMTSDAMHKTPAEK